MFKALIVEDEPSLRELMREQIEDLGGTAVEVSGLSQIPTITDDEFDVVVWDGEISGGDTIAAIISARKTFTKLMLGVSSQPHLRDEQGKAGCCTCSKLQVGEVVADYLKDLEKE